MTDEASRPRNTAFIFTKPDVCNASLVDKLVEEQLAFQSIRIDRSGFIPCETIAAQALIDKHYASIASYAMDLRPLEIAPSIVDAGLTAFANTFGLTWSSALLQGVLLNAAEVMRARNLSAAQLGALWAHADKTVQLAPGLAVGHIKQKHMSDIYVINGFYPADREKFTTPISLFPYFAMSIHWYVVSWDEEVWSWKEFRKKVIGATNPAEAEDGSLRRLMYDGYRALGLDTPPTASANGIHASASPLEALQERHIWLQDSVADDPMTQMIVAAGIQFHTVQKTLKNPSLSNVEKLGSGLAFDLVVDHNSSQVVEEMRYIEAVLRREVAINTAFVFLRPRMSTHLARSAVEMSFAQNNINIIREGEISGQHIAATKIPDKHYRSIAMYALHLRPVQIPLTEDQVADFEVKFGSSWKSIIKNGKIFNAGDASKHLGCLTPKELWILWSAHKNTEKIAPGLFVSFFEEQDIYVINGFYPLLSEQLCVPGRNVHYYVVTFLEKNLSWADFRKHVIGASDPSQAEEGTLRRILFTNWRQMGLLEMPSVADNGLHVSASALEAVAERHVWLSTRLDADPIVPSCVDYGATTAMLHVWVSNPTVQLDGRVEPIFDHLRDADTTRLVDTLRAVDLANKTSKVNRAFIFVKPHAVTVYTLSLVSRILSEQHITIEMEGDITSEEIDRLGMVDRHYNIIARYAMEQLPERLDLSTEARGMFHGTFGVKWEAALEEGKIFNAKAAVVQLGDNIDQLMTKWYPAKKVKLASGLYVGYIDSFDMYVLNGFYPATRKKFTTPGKSIHYYAVSWNEPDLTWKDFREKVIGVNNPADADDGTLRNTILKDWRKLQLGDLPNITDNGIHASAGPLEALAERGIWLKQSLTADSFAVSLLCGGTKGEILRSLLENPVVDGDTTFHRFKDLQSSAAVPSIVALSHRVQAGLKRNSAFLFLKPHANTEKMRALLRTMLEAVGQRIDSQGSISCERIAEENLIDKHYHAVSQYAIHLRSAELYVSNEHQIRFELEFGIAWTTAVETGEVLNAAEAERKLGADAAARGWLSAHRKVKLAAGMYVARYDDEGIFVINGFYPVLRARYVESSKSIHWYNVSWDERDLSWKNFRANVIGATNPEVAAFGSLRRTVIDDWANLGLEKRPDIADNVVHASASPLEGVAERSLWLGLRLMPDKDVAATTMLRCGVDSIFLSRMQENPIIEYGGRSGPAFDLLEDMDMSALSASIMDLQARQGPPAPPVYRLSSAPVMELLPPVASFTPRNFAFMFVKPHAITDGVLAIVDVMLSEHQIRIDMQGDMVGLEVAHRKIYDRHFATLFHFAEVTTPRGIDLPEEAQQTFKAKFGVTWQHVLEKNIIYNAKEAMAFLNLTAEKLGEQWASNTSRLRVIPGMYVTRFPQWDIYVINGFYPGDKAKYTKPDAKIHWYVVSWNERDVNWRDFRAKLIGPENPSDAPLDSIRGCIYSEWKTLHMISQPNATDNSIHASAGPIEALAERLIWLDTRIQDDPFAKIAIQRGSSSLTIAHWLRNPIVRLVGGDRANTEGLVFDLFEDTNSLDAIKALVTADEIRSRIPARNTAFVFLKPPITGSRYALALMDAAFRENKMLVERSGDMTSEEILRRGLIDKTYVELARYGMVVPPSEIPIDELGEAKFRKTFGASWREAVDGGIVLNAKSAMAQLNLSPEQLLEEWNKCLAKVNISPGFYVAEFFEQSIFVVNGFYPATRERFLAPGKSVHWYIVSWDEKDLHWRDFREKVIGTTNPAKALNGSLRRAFYEQWKSLSLPFQPNIVDNGIFASAGPLESMAERFLWHRLTMLEEDSVGRMLLANGCDPLLTLEWLATNPLIPLNGRTASVFNQLENLQQTDVTGVILDFTLRRVEEQRAKRASILTSEIAAVLEGMKALSSQEDEALRLKGINVAFAIIKPLAVNPKIVELLETTFRANGLHIEEKGEIRCKAIKEDLTIDKHFARISQHALEIKPEEIKLSNDAKSRFLAAYSENWDQLVREGGRIFNALDAAQALGHLTPQQIAKRWWANSTPEVELTPGVVVKYYEGDEVWVINGLYLIERERFFGGEKEDPSAVIRWYTISWDEKTLHWKDFNEKLAGAEVPMKANKMSLRGKIFSDWRALGLPEQPTVLDNAIHVSVSPLEGLAERVTWLKYSIDNDLFGRALLLGRCSIPIVREWMTDPVVCIGIDVGLAYAMVRGKQASEVANILSDATAEEYYSSLSKKKPPTSSDGAAISPTPKQRLLNAAVADKFLNSKTEADLRDFFTIYDPQGTGVIADRKVFQRDFESMENFGCPMPPRAVARLFTQHDRLKDGRMDFEEFAIVVMARHRM